MQELYNTETDKHEDDWNMDYLQTLFTNVDLFKANEIFAAKKKHLLSNSKVKNNTSNTTY